MIEKTYKGSYLQIKTFAMLVDWYGNQDRLDMEVDIQNEQVTCKFSSSYDQREVDEIWRDVLSTMNEYVEAAIATGFNSRHN